MDNTESYLNCITSFLNKIGIPVIEQDLQQATFLPGIQIQYGKIVIDKSQLLYVGDILHEAGHIACMPPSRRETTYGSAGEDQGEEIASQAWSYAAAVSCGVPPEVVFHEAGYKGSANVLCQYFKNGGMVGVPLLEWFQMTKQQDYTRPEIHDPTCFPTMQKWLRQLEDPSTFWANQF